MKEREEGRRRRGKGREGREDKDINYNLIIILPPSLLRMFPSNSPVAGCLNALTSSDTSPELRDSS